jgi:hypothetical protein
MQVRNPDGERPLGKLRVGERIKILARMLENTAELYALDLSGVG